MNIRIELLQDDCRGFMWTEIPRKRPCSFHSRKRRQAMSLRVEAHSTGIKIGVRCDDTPPFHLVWRSASKCDLPASAGIAAGDIGKSASCQWKIQVQSSAYT